MLVRSEESGEAVALVENTVPAGWAGTPLHHHAFDEAFYVIDGELTFQLGDQVVTRGPGELAFAAGGVHHAVANPAAAPPGTCSSARRAASSATSRSWPPRRPASSRRRRSPRGIRRPRSSGRRSATDEFRRAAAFSNVSPPDRPKETDVDTDAQAREILAANRYMVLGTADADGVPWVSPVWFASEDGETFLWMSKPGTRHSRNIAARPEVAIVIFDSSVDSADAAALYLSAVATELDGAERDEVVGVYSRVSEAQGLGRFTTEDVSGDGRWRVYRAIAKERSVLGPGDETEVRPSSRRIVNRQCPSTSRISAPPSCSFDSPPIHAATRGSARAASMASAAGTPTAGVPPTSIASEVLIGFASCAWAMTWSTAPRPT